MKENAREYFKDLTRLLADVAVTDAQKHALEFHDGIEKVCRLVHERTNGARQKLMFIGNGASAAISSHMSTDYWKNGGMRAIAFNDSSLLTCISNDFSYAQVFEKPIEMFADAGDVLFAISSSGKSENILRGARAAKAKGCHVITFSGFREDNPLRSLGDYNFFVPSGGYGPVEIVHLSICHCIVDVLINSRMHTTLGK